MGPLLVLSERLEPPDAASDRQRGPWRVYVHDLGLGAYWATLDYEKTDQSSVQLAGQGLIVWSEGRVRRVDLSGTTEATLLEQGAIESVRVSPDGEKVAVMLGSPPDIVVLDVASGDELLRVASTGSLLAPLREAAGDGPVLGAWSRDSTRLSVVWGEQTALLSLAGDLRVLPADWHVSPDLEYAMRLGESAGGASLNHHDYRPTWASFDVVEVATSNVLWTVSGTDEASLTWYSEDSQDGWWRPTGRWHEGRSPPQRGLGFPWNGLKWARKAARTSLCEVGNRPWHRVQQRQRGR